MFLVMTNRFGFDLPPDRLRWAAAEGVSEDVIAAVLLLHHSSVDEIAPQLSAPELEQVINLVDRNPRLYPPGTVQALKQRRDLTAPTPPAESLQPNAAAVVSHNAAEPACQPDIRNKPDADQMRQAHERRLAMLRARTPESAPEPLTAPTPPAESLQPNAAAVVSHNAAEPACQPDIRNKPDADQMRQAHERSPVRVL
jgi:hypothetical protein